jgi:ribosomal protein S18 acetylase RimI-like enzyme
MPYSAMHVRAMEPADQERVDRFLSDHNAALAARLDQLVDARRQPAFIAEDDGELAGVLTYIVADTDCEILTLHAVQSWQGIGTMLLREVEQIAAEQGCTRLWLITTNDNVDALRFYQRRGFRLARLHPGAVDASRLRIKPGIPEIGEYGIPIRDEIELEKPI